MPDRPKPRWLAWWEWVSVGVAVILVGLTSYGLIFTPLSRSERLLVLASMLYFTMQAVHFLWKQFQYWQLDLTFWRRGI